jgi:hypothetical protein
MQRWARRGARAEAREARALCATAGTLLSETEHLLKVCASALGDNVDRDLMIVVAKEA